jgi:hypothetical protein
VLEEEDYKLVEALQQIKLEEAIQYLVQSHLQGVVQEIQVVFQQQEIQEVQVVVDQGIIHQQRQEVEILHQLLHLKVMMVEMLFQL